MKERLSRILGQLSPDLPSEHETELVDLLYAGIFESLDGGNFADNQTGFTSLRSCAGKLGDVVEYYKSRDRRPLTDLSVIGTMDASDFEYVRTSLGGLCSLDLSDAITVGNDDSDFYVIPDRAFFREDGAMKNRDAFAVSLRGGVLTVSAAGIRGILFAPPGSEHPVSGPHERITDLRELLARIEKDK